MKEKKGFDIPTIVVSMVLLGTMLTVTILKPVEATAFLVDAKMQPAIFLGLILC